MGTAVRAISINRGVEMSNNTIALLAKVPEFENQAVALERAYKVKAMQDEASARTQGVADDAAIRDVYRNVSDPNEQINALYKVSPKAAMATEKARADVGKINADTKNTELGMSIKKIDAVGQALGYVMKNPSVDTARHAVDQLKAHGMLTEQEAAQYHTQIDTNPDPAKIKEMAAESYTAALNAKDQLMQLHTQDIGGAVQTTSTDPVSGKQTLVSSVTKTQSPDSAATDARVASEGRLNRANQIAVQDRMTSRQDARLSAPGAAPSLSEDSIQRLAEMELNGDKSGRAGMGRGTQGAANLVAVQNAITKIGAERGVSPRDITAASASLEGLRTGMRATGNISARVENAAEEAAQLAPLALAASKDVARSGFLPFGKAQIMFDTQSNDPALARFATANLGLATAYASAMARGGKPTVSDNEHARKILNEAGDQASYEVKVDQLLKEIEAAKRAPRAVRADLAGEINGKGVHAGRAAQVPPTNARGWALHKDAAGNQAYVSPDGKQFEEVR